MVSRDWHNTLLFESWIHVDQNVIDKLNDTIEDLKFIRRNALFVYVDMTDDKQLTYYVGKGNKNRVRHPVRNDIHDNIRVGRGIVRCVVDVSFDEKSIFDEEIRLIAKHDTYAYKGSRLGANKTLGGDGSHGSIRSESAKRSAGRAVKQLTLDGELIAIFSSVKAATSAVPGSSVVLSCQGKLQQSKGFKWEYVNPEKAVTRSITCRENIRAGANKREVMQMTLSGETLAIFSSVLHAHNVTSVGTDNIRRVCIKNFGTAGGFKWQYST